MTTTPDRPRAVVVSPHLDDAVLSCGGWAAVARPEVVTVFAGVPPRGTSPPTWDRMTGAADSHDRVRDRLAEDDRALAELGGLSTHRLDLLDGQYRTGPVPHDEVVARLRPHVGKAEEIWAPAALGHHVDHLAARDAALAVAVSSGARISLYADIPYALVYGWPAWVDGTAPQATFDAGVWIEAELASAGLEVASLRPAPRRLDEDALEAKLRAMAAYTSQLPVLDAQAGFRLSDRAVMAYELAWTVPGGGSPLRPDWVPGAGGGYLPGSGR